MTETPEKIPEKIGPYKIESLLDKGGMSYLYLGLHPELQTPLAIKVLSRKYISNPEAIQRFINEAEIISMTDHPNIVKMHAHGEWEGGLYIAMEYIEGISLRKYLQKNPISLKRALGMIIEIAYALCHLHTHGVIHRDLKPENILITDQGMVKVIDFGIAQLISDREISDEPRKPRLIGTPIYISPEQRENPETVTFPSDIYSLGIIAYELILGKPSFGHIHLSLMPKGVQTILYKCLQPNPDDRYQDIVDFITDASNYLNSPALLKERQTADALSDLSEEIKNSLFRLVPKEFPNWNDLEIGIASNRGVLLSGQFYEFIQNKDNSLALFIGESSGQGLESFLNSAYLLGMSAALRHLSTTPEDFLEGVNELLIKEKLKPLINAAYILFKAETALFSYISCGEESLYLFSEETGTIQQLPGQKDLIGLKSGLKVFPVQQAWPKKSILFATTRSFSSINLDDETLQATLKEQISLNPQLCAESFLRKIKLTYEDLDLFPPFTFLCIKRKS